MMKVLILDSAVEDSEYLSNFEVNNTPMFSQRGNDIVRVSDSTIVDSDLIIVDLNNLSEDYFKLAQKLTSPLIRRLSGGGVLIVFSARPITITHRGYNYGFLYTILNEPYGFFPNPNFGKEIIDGINERLNKVFNKHQRRIRWNCTFNINKGEEGFFPILGNKANETISLVLRYGPGLICFLPIIEAKSTFIDDFLPAFFDEFKPTSFDYSLKEKERETDPDWLSTYPVAGTETLLKDIASKEEQIVVL